MPHSKKRNGVNLFLSMMSRKTRAHFSTETEPYQCPIHIVGREKKVPGLYKGTGLVLGIQASRPKFNPQLAVNTYLTDLKFETPPPSEVTPNKKKMNPHDQQKYAASKPRHRYKNLPKEWTREKIARAYETTPLRGIPTKSTWLEKRAEKYDFPLCRWKVRRRVIP